MNLLHYIYTRPLRVIVLWMLLAALGWSLAQRLVRRGWRVLNAALLVPATAVILRSTLLSRSPGQYAVRLRPFLSLAEAGQQPELYRSMLMNVFLFFPLGLTLSNALPRRRSLSGRIALTAGVGLFLSAAVEFGQYHWGLGIVETDDVICNTLGALLGAAALAIPRLFQERRNRT